MSNSPDAPRDPQRDRDPSLTTELFVEPRSAAGTQPSPEGGTPVSEQDRADETELLSLDELRELAHDTHIPQLDETQGGSDHGDPGAEALARAGQEPARPGTWPMSGAPTRQQPEGTPVAPPGAPSVPPTMQTAAYPPPPPTIRPQQSPAPVARSAAASPPSPPPPPRGAPPAFPAAPGQAVTPGGGQQPGAGWPPQGPPPPGGPGGWQPPPPPPGKGRRGWWIAAAVFGILALVAAVVAGAVFLGSQGDEQAQPQSTPTVPEEQQSDDAIVSPSEDPDASTEPSDEEGVFSSPSGNITCELAGGLARCSIASADFNPPMPPDGCTWNGYGTAATVNAEEAGYSCEPNDVQEQDIPVLDYGESRSAGGITCASSEQGMRCESDEGGHGFQIARAGISFFP